MRNDTALVSEMKKILLCDVLRNKLWLKLHSHVSVIYIISFQEPTNVK